jgi:dTDP-4-dehydrorhamnose 3,5-epimerase
MPLEAVTFDIPGPIMITPKRFGDARGFVSETYSARSLAEIGIHLPFVQDNHSLSAESGTIRGLHFQRPPFAQDKLVRVVRGSILDIAIDIRIGSPTYGRHVAATLSADNWQQLFVPTGFAHGFCTLEPETEVVYKVTNFYSAENDRGILWNDPSLGIAWPSFAQANISAKDAALPLLVDVKSPFQYTDVGR